MKAVAILWAMTGSAFVTSAELQGEGMQFRNMFDGAGVKRHHRSITHPGRLQVKGTPTHSPQVWLPLKVPQTPPVRYDRL